MIDITLHSFEGPLDLLLHLIQRDELDLNSVSIIELINQFLSLKSDNRDDSLIDQGADFIGLTSTLHLWKSRSLLPKTQHPTDTLNDELDANFEVIHQLIEYCRFKDAAKKLADLESQQSAFYERGRQETIEPTFGLGVEHLSLQDLAALFQKAISKADANQLVFKHEQWQVKDKIASIRQLCKEQKQIFIEGLLTPEKSRAELVVIFLAILELMKSEEILVIKQGEIAIIIPKAPTYGK